MSDDIKHYGTPRHSGRYPWGSGDDPEQRNKSFLGQIKDLKSKGLSDVDIAKGLGLKNTTELRAKKTIAIAEERKANVAQAVRLKDKGYGNTEIGKLMGASESTVRSWLNPAIQDRSEVTASTAHVLKEALKDKKYLDVGAGAELYLGVTRTKLNTAIAMLQEEGHMLTYVPVKQLGTGKNTTIKVLSKPEDNKTVELVKILNDSSIKTEIAKRLKVSKDNVNMESEAAKMLGMSEDEVRTRMKQAYSDVFKNKDQISMPTGHYSEDGGRSFLGLETPRNVDSKRILIKYGDEGGKDKDGVIELRRGVDELSLGSKNYAQVRIAVDGTHYMKGMAMYSEDIPKGYDVIYNTNKSTGTPKEKVFKEMKNDPDNPFGSSVRQRHYIDKNGKKQLSALNIMGLKEGSGEEGAWDTWSKSISSQVLSKQPPSLAKKQLGLAYDEKKREFDEIMRITNPVIKKKLLDSFADECDSDAVHLKAAALPRQASRVLLPMPSMKENEVYAPTYKDGESVVLIRYPHGGRFEIPELIVNNRQPKAKRILGQVKDAIGIHPKVAERLSGADFDGDFALVIPNNNKQIKSSPALKGLQDFDPKTRYGAYEGMRTIDGGVWNESKQKVIYPKNSIGDDIKITRTKGMKMGDISNLITDMTIKGANDTEIAAAVRHSMVVIDAEKHHLNYKQSYIDNGIGALKKKYQGSERSGASTLISKASSEQRVDYRVPGKKVINPSTGTSKRLYVDPKTGAKLYDYTGETYVNGKGKTVPRTISSTKMYETKDAYELVSSSMKPIEVIYADHANRLKALGNESRKVSIGIKPNAYSPEAKKAYAPEVDSLNAKLNVALKNAPLERQALLLANSIVKTKKDANPNMDGSEIKKVRGQALAEARSRVGSGKTLVDISAKEWEAIQAGAVSTNTLLKIMNNTDPEKLKQLATPKPKSTISSAKEQRIRNMLKTGHTQADIADALGISTSVVSQYL